MKLLLAILAALLTGCTSDPLRRSPDEFPPAVELAGDRVTRTGFILKNGGIAYQFDF